jgi:uncharacterized protein (DUF2141 family)
MKSLVVGVVLAGVALWASPAAAELVGEDAAVCRAGQGPAILADIVGLKDRRGEIRIELYPANQEDFLRADYELIQQGKVFRRVRAAPPANGPVSMCLKLPAPGRYAVVFTHNRAGKDKFNIWRDGAGVTHPVPMGLHQPRYEYATVDAGPGVMHVTIQVQYLRGLSGFGPADKTD